MTGRVAPALVIILALLAGCTGGAGPIGPDPVGTLPEAARTIMAKPEYSGARWLYRVSDPETGEVLLANRPDELVFTGSTAKEFTIGSAYATLGPDRVITTPVYALGKRTRDRLAGTLVLVASGDLALGGRGAMQGRVDQAFTATTIDHVYGDIAPTAALVKDDPLAGLDSLAQQVASSGIKRIDGDVVIDTRLWQTFDGQEGPVPPIFVNDNILDLTVTGGSSPGRPATVRMRPQTAAFTVRSAVKTAPADAAGELVVTPDPRHPERLTVSGTIGVGASQVTIHRIPDAATWARSLFIEALRRAGVTVSAPTVARNSTSGLPGRPGQPTRYPDDRKVATLTSPPLERFGTMILLTSYDTGANAVLCLLAAGRGSTHCTDGLKSIREQVDAAELDSDNVLLFDGQGADPASTTPTQMAAWMTWVRTQPWGDALVAGQPVLGESGTMALSGHDSPARGKIAAKTGTSLAVDPATGRAYAKVQSLAGYLTTNSGRTLVLALSMSGGTYPDVPTALTGAGGDVNAVAAAFQQAIP